MEIAFPNESEQYRAARDDLLQREIELRRATEAVAAARRDLPAGGVVPQDYVFEAAGAACAPAEIAMSQLFAFKDTVAIYSFMFGPERERACPSCTSFLDAFDGAIEHVRQRLNFYVVAESPIDRICEHGKERGWQHLPLLSAAGNDYNRDYLGRVGDGTDVPMLNVFRREADGTIRHFWGSEMLFSEGDDGQDPRPSDSIDPQWGMFDFTPEGRGDFHPALDYT
jgi:predicted dithiol-disulfide oxidoreductase (DUF899 family)